MSVSRCSVGSCLAVLLAFAASAAGAKAQSSSSGASAPRSARGAAKNNSGCWAWPDSMDGVRASPQNHTVLYEDSNVRVLDVHTPPHTTNSRHDHQWLSVFLQEEAQPLGRDHGSDGTPGAPGGVVPADAHFPLLNIAGTQAPHAFENLDTFNKHFYRVELKQVPFECPAPNGAMVSYNKERLHTLPDMAAGSWNWPDAVDAVITSQRTDTVRFENFDVRFVEVTVPPGQKQNPGAQLYPSVLIFYQPQPRGVETSAGGESTNVERRFEGAKFPQAVREGRQPPHAFENKDDFPAHYYRMEFKKINYKG